MAALVVGVLVAFSYFKGAQMTTRLDRVIGSVAPSTPSPSTPSPSSPSSYRLLDENLRAAYRKDVGFQDLSPSQQQKVVALGAMGDGRFADYHADLPKFIRSADQYVIIRDTTSRFRMALEAFDQFMTHKWLGAGIGYYTYTEVTSTSGHGVDTYSYPHNILLEILATMGIGGSGIFLLALIVSVYALSAGERGWTSLMIFKGYLFFILTTALFAGDYHDFRLFWLIGLALALSYGSSASAHRKVPKETGETL
jgi:hypothetical protein